VSSPTNPFDFPTITVSLNSDFAVFQADREVCRAWRNVVNTYFECRLSYPDLDKLPAMAGVAEEFARLFSDAYLAGLFLKQPPEALLWSGAHYIPQEARSSSSIYRCPTWSWAKLNTAVVLRVSVTEHHESLPRVCLAHLVNVYVELHDPKNEFGRLNSVELILSGRLIPFRWDLPSPIGVDQDTHPFEMFRGRRSLVVTGAMGPGIYTRRIDFDYTDFAYEAQKDAYFVPIEMLTEVAAVK
jgi:hypothetical protein